MSDTMFVVFEKPVLKPSSSPDEPIVPAKHNPIPNGVSCDGARTRREPVSLRFPLVRQRSGPENVRVRATK